MDMNLSTVLSLRDYYDGPDRLQDHKLYNHTRTHHETSLRQQLATRDLFKSHPIIESKR